jgi:hypothetical protein
VILETREVGWKTVQLEKVFGNIITRQKNDPDINIEK